MCNIVGKQHFSQIKVHLFFVYNVTSIIMMYYIDYRFTIIIIIIIISSFEFFNSVCSQKTDFTEAYGHTDRHEQTFI